MLTQPSRWLVVLGLAIGLAAGGYAYQRGQASQVAWLAHIEALSAQLASNNQQRAEANTATVRSIAHYVCLNYSQPADLAVLDQTQQIQARTQALIDTLSLLRRQLQSFTLSPNLTGPLATQLGRYMIFIQRYAPETASLSHPTTAEEWVELGELPLPAALAVLTQFEAQLRRCEAQALQTQAEKMSSHYDGFDIIGLLAVPTTETVLPGSDYQARLFLAQFSHRDLCNMDMTANGVPLTQPSRPGMQVQFSVPAQRLGQPDTVQTYWHGTIRGPLFPSDTVMQLDVPYLIVKPPTP